MPVIIQNTPNPNALKFTVGTPVGPPQTFAAGTEVDDPMAGELLALDGVVSVFMTADFVTLTKQPDADWDDVAGTAQEIIERYFG
jgi:hypothetical protein